MMEPHCAVCGKTKITDLLMFNYGMCLCNRCTEIAAQSFIQDNAERKLKETEKKRESVDVEGLPKTKYESMTEFKDRLRKENDNLLVRIADAHIEANRFRRRYEEAQAAYEEFQDRTRRVWWGVAIAGFAIGTLLTLMFLNPR